MIELRKKEDRNDYEMRQIAFAPASYNDNKPERGMRQWQGRWQSEDRILKN